MNKNFTIFVGDAAGIDKQIQTYCHSEGYNKVKVFAANGKVRNNIGQWEVEKVAVAPNITGFDFYATKDLEMAKRADYGFMIWNRKSRGTFNNMINLVKLNKTILVYMIPDKSFYTVRSMEEVYTIKNGTKKNESVKEETINNIEQLSLFN